MVRGPAVFDTRHYLVSKSLFFTFRSQLKVINYFDLFEGSPLDAGF